MIQLKVLKILSKTPLSKENKCQMLTQAINFYKFIFFLEGVTTFRKFAISYTVEKMIPLQLVIFHVTSTPKCLDRKFKNRAACQRSHSNERHIIHPVCKMLLASREVLKHREPKPLWLLWMIPNQIFNRILNRIFDPFNCKLDSRTQCQQKISSIGNLDISWLDQNNR